MIFAILVFRDLKPHNLLVDKEKGLVKVVDLGLVCPIFIPFQSTLYTCQWDVVTEYD